MDLIIARDILSIFLLGRWDPRLVYRLPPRNVKLASFLFPFNIFCVSWNRALESPAAA